ncbi:MAG: hypothetical protein BGO76_04955 [Caedibacter sp. 38-128]|nr:transglycosylase SLT domain-containing protein [Holosporales bacterium]OJX07225.1 MAG: hypothetical protein BGO76_04955 [Caedibacter sp. 38-128]
MVYRFVFFIVSFLDTSPLFSKALNHHHYTNHMRHIENKHQIPAGLLNAIAKVESGRWSEKEKQLVSWPWVIHAKGEGHYFPTKELAIEAVKNLQAQGIKNIDVGLMQINLLYHPDAFETLDHAFDPKHNIEYAARFLEGLKQNHNSWQKAVAYYHSASPTHHRPYCKKVLQTWREEQKKNPRQALLQERFASQDLVSFDSKPGQERRIITPPIDRLKIFKERMQFRYYQVRDRIVETQKLRRGKVYRLKPVGYKASAQPQAK